MTVREVIALFCAMGCDVRYSTFKVSDDAGQQVSNVRFLHCPDTKGFYPLDDLEDDERLPLSEVETIERRLGLEIPKG